MKTERFYRIAIKEQQFELSEEEFMELRTSILQFTFGRPIVQGKELKSSNGTVKRADIFEDCFIEAGAALTLAQLEQKLGEKGKTFSSRDALTAYMKADSRFTKVSRAAWDLTSRVNNATPLPKQQRP